MKVIKDTFEQSFKLHDYWELKTKTKQKNTRKNAQYSHVHINAHIRISSCNHPYTHI